MSICNGYAFLIGKKDGEAFVAVAASTDGQMEVTTTLAEMAGNGRGVREYVPDAVEWSLTVSCLKKEGGNGVAKGDRARWAVKLPGDAFYGEGEVVSVTDGGGVNGKAAVNVTIRGNGPLKSNVTLRGDWILREGWWDDDGHWYDDEFWQDS